MEDWKKIIHWSIQRWYIYAISLALCLVIGYLYYHFSPSTYKVSASLMLRQTSSQNTQDQLIGMMGFGGKKVVVDEVEILTSPTLYEQVVSQLDLQTLYFYREEGHWKQLYPSHPFTLVMPADCHMNVTGKLTVQNGEYKLHIKDGHNNKSSAILDAATSTFTTHLGAITFVPTGSIQDGKYRIEYRTMDWAIVYLNDKIGVQRSSRESSIIHLQTVTPNPQMMRDVITTMLSIYNSESASDKNIIARETETFLQARIEEVEELLDSAEVALEVFKRTHSIANLENAAESYRLESEKYEQQLSQLDADIAVLDVIADVLDSPEEPVIVLPGNLGITDVALAGLVTTYNEQVLRRKNLLQTAMPENPAVERLNEQILRTRQALQTTITQTRQSTLLNRQSTQQQYDLYASRLQSVPLQEKEYVVMQRYRDSKVKQYKYLLERREANSLLLVSEAVPVKIIERPTINPKRQSPNLIPIMLVAMMFGIGIPVAIYLIMLVPGLLAAPATPKTKDE